jgi:Reverse transcriptase (RNA-dependent DNA polymerase)
MHGISADQYRPYSVLLIIESYITMFAVYIDDMIITDDDDGEIAQLKVKLGKEFEIKDPGQLKYFLRIEVAHGAERIVLSQRKYVLDLLSDIDMLGCKPVVSSIDMKAKISTDVREQVDRERY